MRAARNTIFITKIAVLREALYSSSAITLKGPADLNKRETSPDDIFSHSL